MTSKPFPIDKLQTLANLACDNALREHDVAELEHILHGNVAAQQFYLSQVCFDRRLRWVITHQPCESVLPTPPPSYSFLATAYHGTVGFFSQETPFACFIATVVMGIGLLIGANVYVSHPEQIARNPQEQSLSAGYENLPELVGRITGMIDCRWSADGRPPHGYDNVPIGREFKLDSGVMEITYHSGAKVILQGPCTYEVSSPTGGFLSLGKLTAKVEGSGVGDRGSGKEASGQWLVENPKSQILNLKSPNASPSPLAPRPWPLFTIRTPTAVITDLGTEFGVEVDGSGATLSQVFEGMVQVQTASLTSTASVEEQLLRANEAVRVDILNGEYVIRTSAVNQAAFTREMPKMTIKTLDLVDVVAGGDGFSGRRGRGIDPTNGRLVESLWRSPLITEPIRSDGQFHRVVDLPFIDGVFIPHGDMDAVPVNSAGHIFAGFRSKSDSTWQVIWAGGAMPPYPTNIADVDYASAGHGILLLHSNNAITFDLEAIQQANPGCTLLRFEAITANVSCTTTNIGQPIQGGDAWVLVDGKERFKRANFTKWSGAIPIVVRLSPQDRYLTLATTDGGNGISHDWIVFGDPQLKMLLPDTNTSKVSRDH